MGDVSVLGESWECGCALCVRMRAEEALDAAIQEEEKKEKEN